MKSQFTKERLKKFLSYYRPHRKIFIMDMFFAGLSSLTVVLFPLVSGYLTSEVLNEWDESTVHRLVISGVVLVALTGVKIISNIIYAAYGHGMGAKMEDTMRRELFAHYEALSFDFHAKNSAGRLMTVISNDLTNMTELFHHGPENILMIAIKLIGAFVVMFSIDVQLTLIVFLALPVLAVAAYFTDKQMEKGLLKSRENLTDMNEYAEDALSGIRTVKAFGQEKTHAARFAKKSEKYADSMWWFYKVEALFYETVESYPQFLTMLVVVFGSFFITRGKMNAAVLVTFLLYAGCISEPIGTMLTFIKIYESGKASFIRFMDMLETKPEIVDSENAKALKNPRGEITFEHVDFRYKDMTENVLENVMFTIPQGTSAAFAGASGIGKTTVASLIARFYDVTGGRVLIDGVDIRDIQLESLRNIIGIVQQEVYIFNGTVMENIRYGRPNATDDEVREAAKLADIDDYICSLEKGYDSIVGTHGILLSGGQRQRISIARLFLKDPKILIMDEATSALDYESEKVVQQSIEKLKHGRTTVLIAHRLSTIRNADCIYVLADKHIVQQGKHEQLAKENGEYARLCKIGKL